MRTTRLWKVVALVLTFLAVVAFPVQEIEALCGDCAFILDDWRCVSPPANYARCLFYWDYELHVVFGHIVKVRVKRCTGIADCVY